MSAEMRISFNNFLFIMTLKLSNVNNFPTIINSDCNNTSEITPIVSICAHRRKCLCMLFRRRCRKIKENEKETEGVKEEQREIWGK